MANLVAVYPPANGVPITPATEPMFTITPSPRARIAGSTARHTRHTPSRFVSTMALASSMEVSSTGPPIAMPALFTTASSRPARSRTSATPAATESSSRTSMVTASTPGGVASGRRPAPKTRCPRRESSTATARPIPVLTPVTSTTGRRTSSTGGIRRTSWRQA